jgi:N utilization substance protein A
MGIKLSNDDIALISLFENVTKANVKDCMVDENKSKITFVVSEGQAGLAIGKGGMNIKKLEEKLKKRIEVLEFSQDPLKFLTNIFRPIQITNAYVSEKSTGEKVLHASVAKTNLGMIKSKAKSAKELISKYFNFNEIIIQ